MLRRWITRIAIKSKCFWHAEFAHQIISCNFGQDGCGRNRRAMLIALDDRANHRRCGVAPGMIFGQRCYLKGLHPEEVKRSVADNGVGNHAAGLNGSRRRHRNGASHAKHIAFARTRMTNPPRRGP